VENQKVAIVAMPTTPAMGAGCGSCRRLLSGLGLLEVLAGGAQEFCGA
jgi:hypothetical protein